MVMNGFFRCFLAIIIVASVSSCGDSNQSSGANQAYLAGSETKGAETKSSLFDLFENSADPNTKIEVNKYLWNAALEILDFLPVQEVDPFSGIFITGYGTPPGGNRSYRAAVYIQDPALDARSLNVALQASGGRAVSAQTQRAVEDAILTRARQLRLRDGKL